MTRIHIITRTRIPELAVGITMKKTAEMAGMPTWIAATGHPEPMAILFMD